MTNKYDDGAEGVTTVSVNEVAYLISTGLRPTRVTRTPGGKRMVHFPPAASKRIHEFNAYRNVASRLLDVAEAVHVRELIPLVLADMQAQTAKREVSR